MMFKFKCDVEIPLFLQFFSFFLSDSILTNLIIYKICHISFEYDESDCKLLGSTNPTNETLQLEHDVQQYANLLYFVRLGLGYVIAIIVCLFLGSWSDEYGRKPIILSSQIGCCLNMLVVGVVCVIPNSSPWFLLCSSLTLVMGGGITLVSCSNAYVADVTPKENRGFRLGIVDVVIGGAKFLSYWASSYIFEAIGYVWMHFLGAGFIVIGILYTIRFLPESLDTIKTSGRVKALCKPRNIKELLECVCRDRKQHDRFVIICCIIIGSCFSFYVNSNKELLLLVRSKFQWPLKHYTLYASITHVIWLLGMFFCLALHKLFRISEKTFICIGSVALMLEMLIYGFATKNWHIYVASSMKIFGGIITPMARSIISKAVSQRESGKLFTFIMIMVGVLGLISTFLYTAIYDSTSMFNFFTAGVYAVSVLLSLLVVYLQRCNTTHQELGEEVDDGESDK